MGLYSNLFSKRRIYLDYASAPPVCDAALRAMREAERYVGNPGAIHAEGVAAKRALDDARARIAKLLGVKSRTIVFTSGLTDANNLAIVGLARALERRVRTLEGTHWLVSAIEHASILECFGEVERLGGTVQFLQPDARGIISAASVSGALKKETVLVSIGWGNNEIGTIQPLGEISDVIRAFERAHGTTILLHSDAGQAPVYEPTVVESLGVDLLSLGGNKLYGPHGVGALYLSNRSELTSVMLGGPQERGLRPGTESVALAVGMAAAYEYIASIRKAEAKRVREIRDMFAKQLTAAIPQAVINGDLRHALPHMLNISIPDIQSEYITLALDHTGIAVSTKSACREGEERQSHVVAALGGESWRSENTLRVSLGEKTSKSDILRVVDAIKAMVSNLR